MAYGITNESQLIDHETIRQGCNQYITALNEYVNGINQLNEAGNNLTEKAISFDGQSLQQPIYDVSQELINGIETCRAAAEQVYTEAVSIYNQQVQELNAYYEAEAKRRAAEQNG